MIVARRCLQAAIFCLVWTSSIPIPGGKASTGDAKTDGVIVDLQKKVKEIKTVKSTVRTIVRMMGETFEIVDDLSVEVPGKLYGDRLLEGKIRQKWISDGGYLWNYDPDEKIATRAGLARVYQATGLEADADQPDPTRPFRALRWETIRYISVDSTSRSHYRIFEALPEPTLLHSELPEPPARVRIFVHSEDGLLRRAVYLSKAGDEVVSFHYEAVKLNPKLPKDLFIFVIPAGVHVMDTTDDVIDLLKQLKQGGEESAKGTEK